jgi:hypothetical protein
LACGRDAEQFREAVDAGRHVEVPANVIQTSFAKGRSSIWIADEFAQCGGEGGLIARFHEHAGSTMCYEFVRGAHPGGDDRQLLTQRLHQDVRKPIAVAVLRDAAGQHEDVGVPIARKHRFLRLCASPINPRTYAKPRGMATKVLEQWSTADVNESPGRLGGQLRESLEQVRVALLFNRATDREQLDRVI